MLARIAILALVTRTQSSAPDEAAFCAKVDQARLLKTVRELVALGPRMGGTPSGDAAAKYHAERMKAAGLEPVTTSDPLLDAFQPLRVVARVEVEDETLELVDGTLALGTAPIQKCELPLVPAKAPRPDGKCALLADENDWQELGHESKETAARVLLAAFECRVETSTPVVRQPRGYSGTLLTVSAREKRWLEERLAKPDARATLSIEAEVFAKRGHPLTVSADLRSAAPDAPILVFCAHGDSDSGGPGADDNGSGDATVDELATVFGALAKDAKDAKEKTLALPFTLRFIVWGSEIHSTRAYWQRIHADGTHKLHLGVVNFDETGTGAERDCVYFEPDNLPRNAPLVRLLLAIGGDHLDQEGFWREYTSNAAFGGTDSYEFTPGWEKGGGAEDLPALTIFTAAWGQPNRAPVTKGFASPGWKGGDPVVLDYSKVYHETGDRPEVTTEVEPWNMVWCTKAAGLLVFRLAAHPEIVKSLLQR